MFDVQIKREGAQIAFDKDFHPEQLEQTFWFERSFTKEQYAALSRALRASNKAWIQELADEFAERAVNGYGR